MSPLEIIDHLSRVTESILCSPFEWCLIKGGTVRLENASHNGGTQGGTCHVADFAIAKFPITNAQYQKFLEHPNGFTNSQWWSYSPQALQWRRDHKNPKPTAFPGSDLPRTWVSWFDSMAFCHWLAAEIANRQSEPRQKFPDPNLVTHWAVRLPTEQEWQRAALGDSGWCYPWGNGLDESRGNYANQIGQPTAVQKYLEGKSAFEVMNLIGNVWEWCLTGWGQEQIDVSGYTYRVIKGGAWNINNPDYLRANDRGCHPPRGQLNDCGFRCGYFNRIGGNNGAQETQDQRAIL